MYAALVDCLYCDKTLKASQRSLKTTLRIPARRNVHSPRPQPDSPLNNRSISPKWVSSDRPLHIFLEKCPPCGFSSSHQYLPFLHRYNQWWSSDTFSCTSSKRTDHLTLISEFPPMPQNSRSSVTRARDYETAHTHTHTVTSRGCRTE